MQSTLEQQRRRRRVRAVLSTEAIAIVLAGVAALAASLVITAAPATVDHVSITNPSAYDIRVEVTGGERDGWMALGTAEEGRTDTVDQVIDQGDTWIFSFAVGAHDGGELRMTADQLEQADWAIEVPARVVEQLREQGAPPSP